MSPKGNANPSWFVRPMRAEDIDKCLLIWSRVELTEAHQTVASCLTVDPDGFYVAELEESGEVVGMCSANMATQDTAFVGFYGVEPEYQGFGIGRELWSRTMKRLQSVNVGLYGVPSMNEKYKKSGFKMQDPIRMVIYESSRDDSVNSLQLDHLKGIPSISSVYEDCRLEIVNKNTNSQLKRKLIDYDESVHKSRRENLLQVYLFGDDAPLTFAIVRDTSSKTRSSVACFDSNSQPNSNRSTAPERKSSCCAKPPSQEAIIEDETLSTTIKSCLSISSSNLGESAHDFSTSGCHNNLQVLGYGCIRRDNNLGGMIGPIYADSGELCEVLLKSLIEKFKLQPGQIYSAMGLDSNKEALAIMERIGLKEIDQCTRMFTNSIPEANFSKVFYVHSPNFTIV